MQDRVRFQIRISKETDQRVKVSIPLANCQSQNEFVEKALNYYCSYLMAEDSASILAHAIVDAFRSCLNDAMKKIDHSMFRMSAEVNLMGHVLAVTTDIKPETLRKMRLVSIQEVIRTHGVMKLEDIVEEQLSIQDDMDDM